MPLLLLPLLTIATSTTATTTATTTITTTVATSTAYCGQVAWLMTYHNSRLISSQIDGVEVQFGHGRAARFVRRFVIDRISGESNAPWTGRARGWIWQSVRIESRLKCFVLRPVLGRWSGWRPALRISFFFVAFDQQVAPVSGAVLLPEIAHQPETTRQWTGSAAATLIRQSAAVERPRNGSNRLTAAHRLAQLTDGMFVIFGRCTDHALHQVDTKFIISKSLTRWTDQSWSSDG